MKKQLLLLLFFAAHYGIAFSQGKTLAEQGEDLLIKNEFSAAVKILEQAVSNNEKKANYPLAWCYTYGNGTATNYQRAIKLMEEVSAWEDRVWNELAICHFELKDFEKARLTSSLATNGYFGPKDNPVSNYIYAYCLENGLGGDKDEVKAFEHYKIAADNGHTQSMCNLAAMLLFGKGVTEDIPEAYKYYRKAAEKGHIIGMYFGAFSYEKGIGVAQNTQKALEYYTNSANAGYPSSMAKIAKCYENGDLGLPVNLTEAINYYMRAADAGHVDCILKIAEFYEKGKGLQKNIKLAINYYEKVIDKSWWACYHLATIFMNGQAIQPNYTKAMSYAKKSVELGFLPGNKLVGDMYYNGLGIPKDESKAIYYWELSDDHSSYIALFNYYSIRTDDYSQKKIKELVQKLLKADDDADCQNLLAICYAKGIGGLPADISKALYYGQKAASNGNPEALSNLGWIYYMGEEVPANYKIAYDFFNKAAELGEPDGYNGLAYCYADGKGIEKDMNKAFIFIDKALELSDNEARYLDSKGEFLIDNGDMDSAIEVWNLLCAKDSSAAQDDDSKFVSAMKSYLSDSVDSGIFVTRTESKETFAIIIANENYRREETVPYAIKDGKIFYEYCNKTLGIPSSNIKFLEDATGNDFKYCLNWISNIVKVHEGSAKLLFYYSGHGVPDESQMSSYLLPIDGYGFDTSTGFRLGDLYKQLNSFPSKSIIVFLDACFSGANKDGKMLASSRGVSIKAKADSPIGNMVVFSAAQGEETAYPYTEKQHGLFTYYLLKKMQESKGEIRLGELGEYITTEVQKKSIVVNGKSQTPNVNPSASLGESWKSWTLK